MNHIIVNIDNSVSPPRLEEKQSRYSTKQIALAALGAGGLIFGLWQFGAFQWAANALRTWTVIEDPSNPSNSSNPDDPASIGNVPSQSSSITIFTSYTKDNPQRLSLSQKVANNHSEYCQTHGYHYQVFERNLANLGMFDKALPYWSKIAGINQILAEGSGEGKPSWIVWLDDDALILNSHIKMEEFIRDHGGTDPNTHVIVTSDVPHAITKVNTGVLLVRNSKESKKFFHDLFEMRHNKILTDDGWTTYSTCPNQSCLHEQKAMHDLLNQQPNYQNMVKIIPQTDEHGIGINTFERFNHIDDIRNMYLNYDGDPSDSRCKPQDFICQCTGLATKGRRYWGDVPANLREECIDGLLNKAK